MAAAPYVLVVDDEESMRDSCAQILAKMGCRVEAAADGESGLRLVRESRPDAVIVDLKMPGIGGLEVLDEVRLLDPRIVTVVITGYATVDAAVEAMKRGAYDFLPKPFTPDELRLIIARALERRHLALEAEALRREKKLLEDNVITLVSHQLRSPLVAVQQYFEVLLAGMAGPLEEKPREMIQRAGERLAGLMGLINDWLDLARIDQGGLVRKLKLVDVRAVIDKLLEFLSPLSAEHGAVLAWVDRPEQPVTVLGDEASLEQVLANILHNAVVYNKPGGRVEARVGEEEGYVKVEVSDTGIGIAAEHMPFIFDQFYRVSRGEGTKTKGSGLGLAIAKKIVEAHGGRIDVSSVPGEGTVFTVRLPKAGSDPLPPADSPG
ncbi:MAG: response regulator [Candidatus Aminicenantes bacterium]|nr:response regulator [Candidatus Aminicenantes bacterium]